MHYISKLNNNTIKRLSEIYERKYNPRTDNYEENKNVIYRIDQNPSFNITKNINGKVYYIEKEVVNNMGKLVTNEISCLEIYTNTLKITQLEEWVENRLREYNEYLKSKSYDKQMLFEIGYNPKKSNIDIFNIEWKSNVTFENRFFANKEQILDKINFFMKNPNWYKERGIPYTLGFLLWGEPGCGKTGFIKALMNLTGRHAISIKLNNNFNMNKLQELIYNDNISDDIIIPQSNRIIIFEDIDCMGELVKEREDSEDDDTSETKEKKSKLKDEDIMMEYSMMKEQFENYNNNLSYFLNILDGLHECPGRIIVMTTNKPEQLDKALVRPGRIDFNIHFTKASLKDIKNIIEFYWNKKCTINLSKDLEQKYSHAEIVNFCRTSISLNDTISKLNN
jgi:ATP-dependent 26S proteasome regulatory subunit